MLNKRVSAGDRIKAINEDLDQAVSEILDASELNTNTLSQLGSRSGLSEEAKQLVANLQDQNTRIIAACSVQDVIRQHLQLLIQEIDSSTHSITSEKNNEKLLAGPQVDGQGLRQQDIDDLLE